MSIGRIHSNKKLFAQLVLLGVPTVLLMSYAIKLGNEYANLLENDWKIQTVYFGVGLLLSLFFHAFRFRFISTAIPLVAILYGGYKLIGGISIGEFDAFFNGIKFAVFAFAFALGWFVGYGFSRARYFTIIWSVCLLAIMVVVVSHFSNIKADTIILTFVPTLAYSFYIIYMSELIRNMNEDEPSFAWYVLKRFIGFVVAAGVIIFALLFHFQGEFQGIEKEWGGGGKPKDGQKGGNNLTKEDKDGVSTKNNMGLDGQNTKDPNKAKRLLFVSKLDNFFNDGKLPNPLYYITDYFTKWDVETQQFEIDSAMPYKDHFNPDVSKVPLYFSKTDTSVLRNMMATKMRKVINAEVYKVLLSTKEFTAPSTAFFVQPISVPPEDSNKYRSAYRAKMNVSALNSAYFVYNPAGKDAAQLKSFQEQRFKELRTVKNFDGIPADFMKYYTVMPSGNEYDSIKTLARRIVTNAGAKTYIDEMIALRDYFMAKDENGLPTYKYTDNPGVPGMPSANKLCYFLFQNKKGYCAYYAGATLFLLRALGIPSRVATGFLTVDRSAKNPGWYFFYEDQAHAWVQAFFPGYGWIDFDTTVPSVDQQQAPKPDETPPLTMQQAWLVANGKVESVDAKAMTVHISMNKMLYWDEPYDLIHNVPLDLDVKIAKITSDIGAVALNQVKPGNTVVGVSYAEVFKKLPPHEADSATGIINRFPKPAPIDELKLMATDEETKKDIQKEEPATPFDWAKTFFIALGILLFAVLIIFSLPWLIFQYLHAKAKGNVGDLKEQAYWKFMASTYYLNQLGYQRGEQTSLQFARDVVDPTFKSKLTPFMNTYLKTKYSSQPLDGYDGNVVAAFYPKIWQDVKAGVPSKTRLVRFLNIMRTVQFFVRPKYK